MRAGQRGKAVLEGRGKMRSGQRGRDAMSGKGRMRKGAVPYARLIWVLGSLYFKLTFHSILEGFGCALFVGCKLVAGAIQG